MRRGSLLILGAISELVYLAITWRLPWWRYGGQLSRWIDLLGGGWTAFGLCLAGVGMLMGVYLWGWRTVRRGEGERWVVWLFAILFATTLFWLMPITSDLFTYLSRAHLLTDLGANPLQFAPLDFQDTLLRTYPAFYALYPSVYGPAWVFVSAPGTLGPYDVATGLFYLKGLALLAYLLSVWLVERILKHLRPGRSLEGAYLFAWNPLVVLMAVGDGHNDAAMMAAVLLALWLLLRERWMLAFGLLAFSVWLKYVSAILVPLFVLHAWRHPAGGRASALVKGAAAAGFVSLLVLVPFGVPFGFSEIAGRLLQPVNWQGGAAGGAAWALRLGLVVFAVAYAVLLWRMVWATYSTQRLMDACFVASLLAFVLGAARSQPWHLIWPASLAGLSSFRWAWPVVAGLSAVMLLVQVWVEWGAPGIG